MNRLQWVRDYEWPKARDKALMAVAWRLPRRLAMWTAVRVISHATVGEYSSTVVTELTAVDVLKRWPD